MIDLQRSVHYSAYIRGLQNQIDRERKLKLRTVFVASKSLERNIDAMQLTVTSSTRLRIDGTELGASPADVGKMRFVIGYSDPAGDDVMLP